MNWSAVTAQADMAFASYPSLRDRVVFISGGSSGIGALQELLTRVGQRFGPIRVLVNNAGRDDRHSLDELTPDYWDNCLAVNLKHQVFATQSVARQLRAAKVKGSIINMGSISWMRGQPNLIGYTTSKAAISGMTRTMSRAPRCSWPATTARA